LDCITLNTTVIREYLIGKDVEGSGGGLISDTVQEFYSKDSEKGIPRDS
jgi:hypothetical protein